MSKVRTLFTIDVIIGAAFLAAAASAVAFLVPFSAIDFSTSSALPSFLGLGYGVWRTVHLYAGLAMIVGGLIHIAMHLGWMIRVVKGMLPGATSRMASARSVNSTDAA